MNSANLLITEDGFPVSMKTICDLFNSDFMNWVFGKIFNTHKILRGDLELLPIHDQFLSSNTFKEPEYLDSINIVRTECGAFRIKR
jgi:site-specific DNA-methyltransferase (adenine-specific)